MVVKKIIIGMISTGALLSALLGIQLATATELLKTQTSWDGGGFHYPAGQPEITSFILSLEEGQQTPWHCHPVPTMGHVLEGSIEVESRSGQKIVLGQGESVAEVMGTLHRGKGLKGGVKIVVFYAGAINLPNTVLEGDKEHGQLCAR